MCHRCSWPFVAASFFLCLGVVEAEAAGEAEGIPSVKPSVALLVGSQISMESDLQDTYGLMPAVGARLLLQISHAGEFFAGIGFVGDRGDPHTGSIGFETVEKASFRCVPLEFGTRFNVSGNAYQRVYLGFALDMLWISEKVPGTYPYNSEETPEYSGWGPSLYLTISPEWDFKGERLAFGFEFSLGGNEVKIRHGQLRRTVEMASYGLRAYMRKRF